MYREDCVEQCLVPFLEEHHADEDYFFWPNLPSCHYANETQDIFNKLEIYFYQTPLTLLNFALSRGFREFSKQRYIMKDGRTRYLEFRTYSPPWRQRSGLQLIIGWWWSMVMWLTEINQDLSWWFSFFKYIFLKTIICKIEALNKITIFYSLCFIIKKERQATENC